MGTLPLVRNKFKYDRLDIYRDLQQKEKMSALPHLEDVISFIKELETAISQERCYRSECTSFEDILAKISHTFLEKVSDKAKDSRVGQQFERIIGVYTAPKPEFLLVGKNNLSATCDRALTH